MSPRSLLLTQLSMVHLMTQKPYKFSVRIDGPGVHPGAWAKHRDRIAQPNYDPLIEARRVVEIAESNGIAFCVFDDSYVARLSNELDGVRYDALELAAAIAPATKTIGLVPAVNALLNEPFHVSRAVATVDFITEGRGGWQPQIHKIDASECQYAGENKFADVNDDRAKRADEFLDATRQLWHSWEDDAIIWDVEAGRFLDADKVNRINFKGEFYSIAGPSPTPHSPQGSPLTVIVVEDDVSEALAARYADVAVLRSSTSEELHERVRRLREQAHSTENMGLEIFSAIAVYIDDALQTGQQQKSGLEEEGGFLGASTIELVGTSEEVAVNIARILQSNALDGIELLLVDSDVSISQWAALLRPALVAQGIDATPAYPRQARKNEGSISQ